jgi:hypothetical protein
MTQLSVLEDAGLKSLGQRINYNNVSEMKVNF